MSTTTNLLFLTLVLGLFIAGCTGVRPATLGVKNGTMAPCPVSANCVSSQSSDPDHAVLPLQFSGAASSAMDRLKQVLLGMERVRIVTLQDRYLHAEFTSAIFRFVDDVEFHVSEPLQRIEVRSASRLGRSDLGVNRKRVEEIRMRWNERTE